MKVRPGSKYLIVIISQEVEGSFTNWHKVEKRVQFLFWVLQLSAHHVIMRQSRL